MHGVLPICPWECSYSKVVHGGFWEVTSLSPPEAHICSKYKREQGANAIANSIKVMKRQWGNLVRGAPFISAKTLQQILSSHSKFVISYKQAWRLREAIQKEMYGDWQESFRLLPELARRFEQNDPGGMFKIQTVDGCFHRMYIQPSASRGALGFCRPVVALDGTFLISAQHATLLIAVALDGNQKILMLAWALVEGENKDSWSWFLQHFMVSFPEWPHRDDASIISDRDKGLIPAARDVLPAGIPHYFCAWHLHQNVVKFGEAAALFFWRLVKCRDDDKWDALVSAGRRDFKEMMTYLLGDEKPISGPAPADAAQQQRPAPTTAAEARQQAAQNRRQGREAARSARGLGTTSRARGRGAGDASGPGATPPEPGHAPTAGSSALTAPPPDPPATNEPPSRPSGSTPAASRPFDYNRILRRVRTGYIPSSIRTDPPRASASSGNSGQGGDEHGGGNTCQALVVVSLDHPWPDVGSGNPRVRVEADFEDDVEEADAEEAEADAAADPAATEGNQAGANENADDDTAEAGVANGEHTTRVRTGFRQNKRGTRKKLGINLVHWTRIKAPTRRFGIFTSNAAEQVNSSIVPIRRLPVCPLLGGLWDWYRNRYCERKMAARERTALLTEAAEERMVEKETRAEGYELLGGDLEEGTIQTRDTDDPKEWRSFNVNINSEVRTCDCSNWDQYQFPCSHAVAFALKRKLDPRSLVSDYYTTKNWAETYSSTVRGSCVDRIVLGRKLAPTGQCDAPPFRRTAAGRPPSYARVEKAVHPYKCSVCRLHGHTKNRCMGKYGGSAYPEKRRFRNRPKARLQ
ncbi:unnamed protein product [Closterium sp. NIES-65]|nr:unnamed protein product [Closterium sp. NIES-65]